MLKWKGKKKVKTTVALFRSPLNSCKTGVLNYSLQILMALDLNTPFAQENSLPEIWEQLPLLLMMAPQTLQNLGTSIREILKIPCI